MARKIDRSQKAQAVVDGFQQKLFDPAAIRFQADARAVRALLTNLLENALDACRPVRPALRSAPERPISEMAWRTD